LLLPAKIRRFALTFGNVVPGETRRGEDEPRGSNALFVVPWSVRKNIKHDSVQDKMTEYNIGPAAGLNVISLRN